MDIKRVINTASAYILNIYKFFLKGALTSFITDTEQLNFQLVSFDGTSINNIVMDRRVWEEMEETRDGY